MGVAGTKSEFDHKIEQIRALLQEKKLDAMLLQRFSSMAWVTCGADFHINTAASDGSASLLVTPQDLTVFTNNIEASRLEVEEGLGDQGWKFEVAPWYASENPLSHFMGNMKIGTDGLAAGGVNLADDITWLRSQLSQAEVDRFKNLGKQSGQIMDEAARAVRPGMTEYQIAALLSKSAESRGIQAVVNLVATDERIFKYRHPLPTDKKLDRYAMLILCGRKWGLICSITRLVHFGPLSDEIVKKSDAVAEIDAAMITATRPGKSLADILDTAIKGYDHSGFRGEWKKHHQGGLAGYEPREITATPDTRQMVACNQVYAWNPSITGSKSEDTFLVAEAGNEILTEIPGWPVKEIEIKGKIIKRPAILVKE